MPQEAIIEVDMDVFSRRIGPYFTWLESRIEGGWQQNDNVQKDVLKEAKYLATTMRARFILGVARDDFSKEVSRTIELFELATEAFPGESDEIESKVKHFCKGIAEELGTQFLPKDYQETPRPPEPPEPHPFPSPEPEPKPEPDHPQEPEIKIQPAKIKIEPLKPKIVVKPKAEAKPVKPKIEIKPKAVKQKIEVKPEPKLEAKVPKKEARPAKQKKHAKKRKSKSFFLTRWVKNFIWGRE